MKKNPDFSKIDFSDLEKVAPILDYFPVAIEIADTKGVIQFCNDKLIKLNGYDENFFVGRRIADVYFHNIQQRRDFEKYWEHLVNERPAPSPYFHVNIGKNGEKIPIRVDWEYIYENKKLRGFACLIYDLREQKGKLENVDVSQLDALSREVYLNLKKEHLEEHGNLTAREREILSLLCEGHSSQDIADNLEISVRTVDKHRENILKKTNHDSINQLLIKILKRK